MNSGILLNALSRLIGRPRAGNLVFTRCLSHDDIAALLAERTAWPAGWRLFGVGASTGDGWITADQAVELREGMDAMGAATVLLVDLRTAGAGMDGVYSAAREIAEADLFGEASKIAETKLPASLREFAREAVRCARRVGGRRGLVSHRQQFDFYSSLVAVPLEVGRVVTSVGLWPLAGSPDHAASLLPQAGLMVAKLLIPPVTAQAPATRISGLTLEQPPTDAVSALEDILRRAGTLPLKEVLGEVARDSRLWLGNLKPGFLTNQLLGIELTPWRNRNGGLAGWSGLAQAEEEALPQFVIDRNNHQCRLQVRWRVRPENLPKGAASFEVRVLAGDEALASRQVEWSGRSDAKVVFTPEDFDELEESARLEACIEVAAPGADGVEPKRTEDFLVLFGETAVTDRVASGEVFRTAVDGLIQTNDRAVIEQVAAERQQGKQGRPDTRGFLTFRLPGSRKGFRVERPLLLSEIEKDWARRGDAPIGRWVIRCRPDGSLSGDPTFESFSNSDCPEAEWQKLGEATRRFREDCLKSGGVLSRVYVHGHSSAQLVADYLNAWQAALEKGSPRLIQANTVEVQTLAGRTLGLIVLPFHCLRLAWQSAYDTLALHLRLNENLPVERARQALEWLDGAHFPFALPGLREGEMFVFGDVLGLAGVAMVSDADREPKAAIAMMAACYTGDSERLVPVLSTGSGDALAREIQHYLDTHPNCHFLHVHALRPGDGATVVRALGRALHAERAAEEDDQPDAVAQRNVAVRLELHPSEAQSGIAGRHLVKLNQRRRAGSGAPPPEDSWCLESMTLGGGRTVPRLRWAKREPGAPRTPAHLAIAFDTFRSAVNTSSKGRDEFPLLAFGLVAHLHREFGFEQGRPRWRLCIPGEQSGEKLPERIVTERLLKLHTAAMEACARQAGRPDHWPVLVTEPCGEDIEMLAQLHRLCDWVVTMDRNAGIEYFDSPREAEAVFEAYVIDAVPERDDLGCLQLITSTAHFDEVRHLLDETLALMGLSSSARNCAFLLGQLKALSGRLAMRLAAGASDEAAGRVGAELVALALARKKSLEAGEDDPCWPSLRRGFFVPLDDVRDLIPEKPRPATGEEAEPTESGRADLLYVSIAARGRLGFRFVEVKYRRHLALARAPGLQEAIARQTGATRERWMDWFFGEDLTAAERTLRAARLARVLRFYAEKARRHHLDQDAHRRFTEELARLLAAPAEYEPAIMERADRGLVFCPDFLQASAERLGDGGSENCEVWLFGPDTLPDKPPQMAVPPVAPPPPETSSPPDGPEPPTPALTESERTAPAGAASETVAAAPGDPPSAVAEPVRVRLGLSRGDEPVVWAPSLRGNPHLMIIGLPGMGKTTCLINLCRQLQAGGITPIVFSYHDDIDEGLTDLFPSIARHDCRDLGFNPMRIVEPGPVAHVECAGQLRDIFQAIFPDLGDLQLEQLRGAIKQSYEAAGWGGANAAGRVPAFRDFLQRLRRGDKPDTRTKTLLARLTELDDFGFFSAAEGDASLLDAATPRLIRIHAVANDVVQRAYASFVLYRVYQDMFRRGRQERMTHAVIFDEAHRASRLKLLPTMAKECRKYGLALIVASQEARDFDAGLFAAIANYLVLRVTDADARAMARNVAPSDQERRIADRLKNLPKFEALFFTEGQRQPTLLRLEPPE
jgi:DNA helicase HerA-like ATPase